MLIRKEKNKKINSGSQDLSDHRILDGLESLFMEVVVLLSHKKLYYTLYYYLSKGINESLRYTIK